MFSELWHCCFKLLFPFNKTAWFQVPVKSKILYMIGKDIPSINPESWWTQIERKHVRKCKWNIKQTKHTKTIYWQTSNVTLLFSYQNIMNISRHFWQHFNTMHLKLGHHPQKEYYIAIWKEHHIFNEAAMKFWISVLLKLNWELKLVKLPLWGVGGKIRGRCLCMLWVKANVGTFMPLGNLLVELMSHREDNVSQHTSEAHLACHFNLWIINFLLYKIYCSSETNLFSCWTNAWLSFGLQRLDWL